jgi:glycosyltransferase involved in cell wall biosynthesis
VKRALFLTYYVPPRPAIASVRAQHIISSLRERGWEVTPVVPDLGEVAYQPPVRTTGVVDLKTPVRRMLGVRAGQTTHERFNVEHGSRIETQTWKQRALLAGHQALAFADGRLGWLGPGVRAVKEILRAERVDAVISTSPPVATHLVAARSHGGVPWIADLRDPWLRNDRLAGGPVLHAIDMLLESYAFETASTLVTVSEPLAQRLRMRYPKQRVYAIPNAFSRSEWESVPFTTPPAATFLHAGQLYRGIRNPQPFFEAIGQLASEGAFAPGEVRVDLYGEQEPWLQAQIAACRADGIVHLHGRLAREEILVRERAASRLLIFTADGVDEQGTFTGKLFEYLGARRRIIAIGGPAETIAMDEVLTRSGAGIRQRDVAGLRLEIMRALEEWRRGDTAQIAEDDVAPYEVAHFGAAFADVLETITCNV